MEVELFSFNETDYGVQVHQSGEEHARLNKALGRRFRERGLVTRMVLGDTGAATVSSNRLTLASEADSGVAPYLGGIAFHTYHGVTAPDLLAWADSARRMNLPLFVNEGGADSAAHRYPLVWKTAWFAQREIDQYVRIASVCQPASILPWQLNADYSLLAGGGIYGDHGPLRPTQRFWCLKQLGDFSAGAFWLPIAVDRASVSCAASGDLANGRYAIHVVNNGATRMATVRGLPAEVSALRIFVTDAERGMQFMALKGVVDGAVSFQLERQTFTTLASE